MSQAENPNTTKLSRRSALAGLSLAAATTVAAGAVANTIAVLGVGPADPIFSVIENYKRALVSRKIALEATWDGGNPAFEGLASDAPACLEAEDVHDEAVDREWEACGALFTTSPTTIAGVAALLDYLVTDPYFDPEQPHLSGDIVLSWAIGRQDGRDFVRDFMTNLASTLRTLDQSRAAVSS
jgi:hypothetical protein